MLGEEREHGRQQLRLAEGMRHHHPQASAQRFRFAVQFGLQRLPFVDHALRMALAAQAIFGQLQAMGGALQQAQAELPLQCLKAPADRRLGGAQLHGGGRQAAGIDDAQEGAQQIQAIGAGGEVIHACHV